MVVANPEDLNHLREIRHVDRLGGTAERGERGEACVPR
jgi:hypothetical protein